MCREFFLIILKCALIYKYCHIRNKRNLDPIRILIYIYILLKYDKIVKYSHPRLISLPRSNKIGMGSGYFIFFFLHGIPFSYIYLQKKERTRRLAPPLFIWPIYFENNVMCLPLPAEVNIHLISPQRINAAFGDSQTAFGLYGN